MRGFETEEANNTALAAKMVVEAKRVAKSCLPGQFVIVRMDEEGERIPLTICDYDAEKGTITIVFQIIGAGTMKLAKLQTGVFPLYLKIQLLDI